MSYTFAPEQAENPHVTLGALTGYLQSSIRPPEKISLAAYKAMTAAQQRSYNRDRDYYLDGSILLQTPQVVAANDAVEKMVRRNTRRADAPRPGLIISGPGSMGKTTITRTIMRSLYDSYAQQFPGFEQQNRHPVVYIEVPVTSTGKSLLKAFAHFFGITVATRDTQESLMIRVTEALRAVKTELVVVDEIHNLSAANRGNGESIQTLRQLHSQVPAIFVYAGINLRDGHLFEGPTGRQLSGRFAIHEIQHFTLASAKQRSLWRALVRAFEKELLLFSHEPKSLDEFSDHLHDITGGSIATLSKVLSGCARDLIANNDPDNESITLELIDAQLRDMAAADQEKALTARTNRRKIA